MRLPDYFARRLVGSDAEKSRMPQLAKSRPLDEAGLYNDLGSHPMRAETRESDRLSERRLWNFQGVEPRSQFQQQLGIESGAKLAGVNQFVVFEVSNQKGAQAFPYSLWHSATLSLHQATG